MSTDDLTGLTDFFEDLENSSIGVSKIPGELESIVDPALLQSLGELLLSDDLNVTRAAEDAMRTLLMGNEMTDRLTDTFTREQELEGAALSGRGIPIRENRADEGLPAETARELGTRQGQRFGDLQYTIGTDMMNIIRSLGDSQMGGLQGLGETAQGAVSRSLQGILDDYSATMEVR